MCADRVASFVIGLDADSTDIRTALSGLRTQFQSAVSDIAALSRKTNVFEGLEQSVSDAAAALAKAKQDVTTFTGALEAAKGAGKDITKELQSSLAAAQKATTSATTEYNRQVDAISKLQGTLSRAGVDTSNLAAAQAKLAEQSKNATNAAANQAAQQLLGLKTVRDTTPEVQKLYAAYNTLAAQGGLSVKELATAQAQLQTKVAEVRAGVSGIGTDATAAKPDLVAMFANPLVHVLGLAGGVASLVAGMKSAIDAAHAFSESMAQLSAGTNLTTDQLSAIGDSARALSRTLGLDVNEALKATFDLLRSQVPEGNVMEVVQRSAEAAKVTLNTLGEGVKASDALLSAFRVPVADLGRSLNVIVQGFKDGGLSIKEFGESAGPLLNVAQAAHLSLEDVVATLTKLRSSGLSAEESISGLTKIIVGLDSEPARQKLHGLGIEVDGLVGTFTQLGEKGLSLSKVLDLEIVGAKSAAAMATLTNNSSGLSTEFDKLKTSTGATAEALAVLLDTPKERAARFNAELEEAKRSLGELTGSGSLLGTAATAILHEFNQIPAAFSEASKTSKETNSTFLDVIKALIQMDPLAAQANRAMKELAAGNKEAGDASADFLAKLSAAQAKLDESSKRLLADAQALQAAAARDITDLATRAEAQIAALSKAADAQAATAKATITIQTQLAADRFAIIQKNEKDVNELALKAANERRDAARAEGKEETAIAAEVAQIRIGFLAPILVQYQDHYNKLVGQAQDWAAKIRAIDGERVDFNRGIEKSLFDQRIAGLSSFDQYLAKVKEVDRLIAEARTAGDSNNIALARKYTDEAIALSKTIGTAVSVNGQTIISEFTSEQQKLELVKKASDGYNESLDKADDLAKQGAAATKKGLDEVIPKLIEARQRYDDFKADIAEGLAVEIKLDKQSVADAFETLNKLSEPRTVTVTVNTVQGSSSAGATGGFAAGGTVGRMVQTMNAIRGYASGGSVFRQPTWSKVPGSGNEDTVPARLSIGSYVVRKLASGHYGDGIMSRLAQGYAGGGGVLAGLSSIFHGRDSLSGAGADGLRGTAYTLFNDLFEILARNVRVPAPAGELDYRKYLQNVYDLINLDLDRGDTTEAQTLYDSILKIKDSIRIAAEQANIWHVPLVYGTNAVFGEDFLLTTEQIKALAEKKKQSGGTYLPPSPVKRAAGGGVDSVDALLTPGEHVLQPKAVSYVARMFGGGFLDALNQMRIPKSFLDNIGNIAPPSPMRFEHGGLVPGGGPVISMSGAGSAGRRPIELHFHSQKMDADEVRRTVVPELRKIMEEER